MSALQLLEKLGIAAFMPRAFVDPPTTIKATLTPQAAAMIADMAHLKTAHVTSLVPTPATWIIQAADDAAFCPWCYIQDVTERREPYQRCAWLEAWRVFCPTHRSLLLSQRLFLRNRPFSPEQVYESILIEVSRQGQRSHTGAFLSMFDRLKAQPSAASMLMLRGIQLLECILDDAHHGILPPTELCGSLDATALLLMVNDYCAFLLTNFNPAPACAWVKVVTWEPGLPYYTFQRTNHPLPGYRGPQNVRTLACVAHPGSRRSVLWPCFRWLALHRYAKLIRPGSLLGQPRIWSGNWHSNAHRWLEERIRHWPLGSQRSPQFILLNR